VNTFKFFVVWLSIVGCSYLTNSTWRQTWQLPEPDQLLAWVDVNAQPRPDGLPVVPAVAPIADETPDEEPQTANFPEPSPNCPTPDPQADFWQSTHHWLLNVFFCQLPSYLLHHSLRL
jgi:hypothetical protein